jgi:hypothetical protein
LGDRIREGDWEKFGMGEKLKEEVFKISPTIKRFYTKRKMRIRNSV